MRRIFVLMLIAALFMTVLVSCRNKDVKEGADPDALAAQTSSVDAKTNEDKTTVSGDESSSVELTTSTLTATSAKPGTTTTSSKVEVNIPTYPRVKRDVMTDGTKVTFKSSEMLYQDPEHTVENVLVLTSVNEINAFLSSARNKTHNYNEKFFEDNSVIIIFRPGPDASSYSSGSFRMQVDSLVRMNDEICIGMTGFLPSDGIMTTDVNSQFIMVEVKNADIAGVNKYSYFVKFAQY